MTLVYDWLSWEVFVYDEVAGLSDLNSAASWIFMDQQVYMNGNSTIIVITQFDPINLPDTVLIDSFNLTQFSGNDSLGSVETAFNIW